MAYTPDPNEVGAGWKKVSQNGNRYVSLSLDLDKFMAANGGVTNGRANLVLFARKGEKTKDSQPDYNLIYSPPAGGKAAAPRAAAPTSELPLDDDEIPF